MTSRLSVESQGLVVTKGRATILRGLDFTIQAGSITGLIGPSGSGKTTLLRTLVGVQAISSGKLEVLGLPAGSKQLRSRIGYVTQAPAIYDDLTVAQNLHYFAVLARSSKSQVEEVITLVHLSPQRNQLAASLSGGQRARVSLAVALLGDPDLLVLDEPTVGLDPLLRQDLWNLFAELAGKGKTLLISSHVMDEADKCQSLLLLREGKMLWHDSREKLLKTTGASSVGEAFINIINAGDRT